jgi:limonene-1,2-epoxide hydrolase
MLHAIRRITLGTAIVLVSLGAHAQTSSASGMTVDEKQAISIVQQWTAALTSKDADKALSFMDEHIQYRDDPFQTTLKTGRDQLAHDLSTLLKGLKSMSIVSAYAVTGEHEQLVLVKRIDEFSLNGKSIQTPIGAYFRIKDGRILEWLDTPLKPLPPPGK